MYTSILLCILIHELNSVYISYVHALRFVSRLLNQDWIGLACLYLK